MAQTYCLVPEIADKLKQAAAAGDISIEKMYEMSSAERRALFEKHIDSENARLVNTEFERAMIAQDQSAMLDWAKRTFSSGEKKTARFRDTIEKIKNLDQMGVLTPENQDAFLEDLVAAKLGVTVTAEEAAKISEISQKLESLSSEVSEFNTPTEQYFIARREMEDYIDSLTPNSRLRVATETIARGTMLASIKSPLLNIESNTVNGVLEAFSRRLQTRRIGGKNNALSWKYIAFATKIYRKTGFDITRMQTLESDRLVRGEEKPNTQGKGVVRGVGRMYEDLIFRKTQGLPDVVSASIAFSDRANIESTKIARSEGLRGKDSKTRAAEIFKDATSITPQTPEGKAVRESAIADSMYATYTNKSVYSDFALGIRKLFNIPSKDLRAGDLVLSFVKTPANVIGAGIDNSGIFIPADVTVRMLKTLKGLFEGKGTEAFGDNWQGFNRKLIRAGLGITFAYLLSNLFKPEDYIGAYPTTAKERELLKSKNVSENSLKINGKWVSLDYFGALGAPLVGFMYAKKYGNNLPNEVFQYYKGVLGQLGKIPGTNEIAQAIAYLKTSATQEKNLDDYRADIANYFVDFTRARTIPSIVSDVAQGIDDFQRKTDKNNKITGVEASIPTLREELPVKYNVFGQAMKSEPLLSVLLFGARVKTANNDPVVNELSRLQDNGDLPPITDASSTSPRVKSVEARLGEEKFTKVFIQFGRDLHTQIQETMNTQDYKDAGDEDKSKLIKKVKDDLLDTFLDDNGYVKPK